MTLKEYQAWVENMSTPRVNELGLAYAGLGLAGETGEVVEKIKKILRDNRMPSEDDIDYLTLELGDVLWYVTKIGNIINVPLETLLLENTKKIEDRKINGKRDAH